MRLTINNFLTIYYYYLDLRKLQLISHYKTKVMNKEIKDLFETFVDIYDLPTTAEFNHQTRNYSNCFYTLEYSSVNGGV